MLFVKGGGIDLGRGEEFSFTKSPFFVCFFYIILTQFYILHLFYTIINSVCAILHHLAESIWN